MGLTKATVTTTGNVVHLKSPHENIVRIQIVPASTMSGVDYVVEAKMSHETDDTNYALVSFIDESTYSDDADAALSSQSAAKSLQLNGVGLTAVRVRFTAFSSGTAAVRIFSAHLPAAQTQIAGG